MTPRDERHEAERPDREHACPCMYCREATFNHSGVCSACLDRWDDPDGPF